MQVVLVPADEELVKQFHEQCQELLGPNLNSNTYYLSLGFFLAKGLKKDHAVELANHVALAPYAWPHPGEPRDWVP